MNTEFTCSVCKRAIDENEIVGAIRMRKNVVVPQGCRITPYVLSKGDSAGDESGLHFRINATCWKCWDTAGVLADELMVKRYYD